MHNCSQLISPSQYWLYALGLVTTLRLFPHLLNRNNPISGNIVVKMKESNTKEIVFDS